MEKGELNDKTSVPWRCESQLQVRWIATSHVYEGDVIHVNFEWYVDALSIMSDRHVIR